MMMGKLLRIFIVPFLITPFARAGEGDYAVSKIPAALLAHVHAVKRMERVSFEVISPGEAVLRKKFAITILDEKADDWAGFDEYYDRLHEIKNIEGILFDAEGRELKKLKNKQVIDLTGTDDNNLADDNRRKYHHFHYKTYPYTVQYEVEIKYNGTLFFPVWAPREREFLSVEQSEFSIIAPAAYTVRYKAFQYPGEPVTGIADRNRKTLSWQIRYLPGIEEEYASPDWYEYNTVVFTGPGEFGLGPYRGDMSSWLDFGKFVYQLKQGRDQLPDHIKQTVHRLTDPLSDAREKIKRLYAYLQQNTRYISIQLGIGGWQPFDAAWVAAHAYGDCKALTNYMFSLLKEAGIPSCYTLVRAGRSASRILTEFPSQQFNHVILCVPLAADTMWLECTSQTLPAGYLGDFTCDRDALLITEEGGYLVRTPRYGLEENTETRRIRALLDEEGTLQVKAETRYRGLQQDRYHDLISTLSKEKVKELLHEELDFGSYDIRSFDYREEGSALPAIDEKLDIVVNNYATMTGKRLFIVPNILTRSQRRLAPDSLRKNDLDLGFAFRDVDTVEISLPAGYTAESVPRDLDLSTRFGNYHVSVRLIGNSLFYYRSVEHFSGRFPAASYPELVQFYETVYKSDRSRVVLIKKQ